jgi:hypothetical protein
MPEFGDFGDLSSIEDEESSCGDEGSSCSDEDYEDYGDMFSEADTESMVSDNGEFENAQQHGPTWHITQPSPSHRVVNIDAFLQGHIDVPKRSTRQWFRFFMRGSRMKTIDQTLLDIAHHLKWQEWLCAGQDFSQYTISINALMRHMDASGLLSTPYFY